jgi:cytochrome b561
MTDTETTPTPSTEPTTGPKTTKRWQKVVSVVLLVIGFILVPISGIAIWSHNQLTNTDRYVETVSPLADNTDIQQAVATVVVNSLFAQVDPAKQIEDALPSKAGFLGQPIATAMKSYATDVTEKLLDTEQFQKLWDGINRRAHTQLVALLTDDDAKAAGANVHIKDGKVTLDLSSVITQVQTKLVDAGLSFLQGVNVPPVSRTIAIINTEGLAEAQSYLGILDTLAWVLPVLAIAALIGSALIVRTRRRATIRAAIVLVASCAFTLALLAIARSLYLDAATSPNVSEGAARAVFDILVRNLRYGIITLAVVGIIVALVAYFVGPSAPAKKVRSLASKGVSGARNTAGDLGYPPNPLEKFVGAHKRGLELAVGAIALLALVLWDQPGVGTVLLIALVALIAVGFIEFLARGAIPETVDEQSPV